MTERIIQNCNEPKESSVTLKSSVIVPLIISFTIAILGFFGFLFNATLANTGDIATVKTEIRVVIPRIEATLTDMKQLTKELREDQLRRSR